MTSIQHLPHLAATSIILLLACAIAAPAHAQQAEAEPTPSETWRTLLAQEGPWTRILTGDARPNALAALDADALSRGEWKALREKLLVQLRTGEDRTWEDAVQQVTYLAIYYPEQAKLSRAVHPLLESYILDKDEQHRIMALAALHALGASEALAHLAQRVHLERSLRVRRLTLAALADHYGARDYYDRAAEGTRMTPPTRTRGQ